MIGFVFVDSSPRAIAPGAAATLGASAKGRATRVGLFAGQDARAIAEKAKAADLDMIQWHGTGEAPLMALGRETSLPLIAARGIGSRRDLPTADAPKPRYYLFDAKPPAHADRQGGHGEPFDWQILSGYTLPVPWLLAGGLTPTTVGEAIKAVRHLHGFAGVDVSSGVERARGEKDPSKIVAFVHAARAAMA